MRLGLCATLGFQGEAPQPGVNLFMPAALSQQEWHKIVQSALIPNSDVITSAWLAYRDRVAVVEMKVRELANRANAASRVVDSADKARTMAQIYQERQPLVDALDAAELELLMAVAAICTPEQAQELHAAQSMRARSNAFDALHGASLISEAKVDLLAIRLRLEVLQDQVHEPLVDAFRRESAVMAQALAKKYADRVGLDFALLAELPGIAAEQDDERRAELTEDWQRRRVSLWQSVATEVQALAARNRAFLSQIEMQFPSEGRLLREEFEASCFPVVTRDRNAIRSLLNKLVSAAEGDESLVAAMEALRDDAERSLARSIGRQIDIEREFQARMSSREPQPSDLARQHQAASAQMASARWEMLRTTWDTAISMLGEARSESLRGALEVREEPRRGGTRP